MNHLLLVETLEGLHKCHNIPDRELEYSITVLEPIVQVLSLLGERYHFAWKELYNDLRQLKSFVEARKEIKLLEDKLIELKN
jgi:hypothetical protein